MNHNDHIAMIRAGIDERGGVWADFGAGWGAFTLALRDLAGPGVEIWSIDRDRTSLERQRQEFAGRFPDSRLRFVEGDITAPLSLPPLDGILAANSLHYIERQVEALRRWRGYLKPAGRLILVEYDTDVGNRWVPFPVSFTRLASLAAQTGFDPPVEISRRASTYGGEMYAALLQVGREPARGG